MTRLALLIVMLTGCDQVFGLERGPATCESLTTHDEDGDTIVDSCDNCPGIPNALQADNLEIENGQIADGVGDACDPRPRDPGDYILELYTFSEADAMTRWQQVDGRWFVLEDQFRYDAPTYDDWGNALNLDAPLIPPFTIEGHLVIDGIPEDADEDCGIGILANSVLGGTSTSCSIERPVAGTHTLVAYHPRGQTPVDIPPITTDSSYRLRMTYNPPVEIVCNVVDGNGQGFATARRFDTDFTHPIGALGLDANRLVGAWDYLIVYRVE